MVCGICNADYNTDEYKPSIIRPCGHEVCSKCLSLIENKICPFCRGNIELESLNYGVLNDLHNQLIRTDKTHINFLTLNAFLKIDKCKKALNNEFKRKFDDSKLVLERSKMTIENKVKKEIVLLNKKKEEYFKELDQINASYIKVLNDIFMLEEKEKEEYEFRQQISRLSLNELVVNFKSLEDNTNKRLNELKRCKRVNKEFEVDRQKSNRSITKKLLLWLFTLVVFTCFTTLDAKRLVDTNNSYIYTSYYYYYYIDYYYYFTEDSNLEEWILWTVWDVFVIFVLTLFYEFISIYLGEMLIKLLNVSLIVCLNLARIIFKIMIFIHKTIRFFWPLIFIYFLVLVSSNESLQSTLKFHWSMVTKLLHDHKANNAQKARNSFQ